MFEINKDYVNEEIGTGGTAINKNGCYELVITDANIYKGQNNSSSECLNLQFESEEGKKAWISLFYKKKDGSDINFNLRHITHLCSLLNVTPKLGQNNKIPSFINKVIGTFLEVGITPTKDGKMGYEYRLIGFYDPTSKQTAKEKANNEVAEIYKKQFEKYKDSQEVTLSNKRRQDDVADMGFYAISDEDIPF